MRLHSERPTQDGPPNLDAVCAFQLRPTRSLRCNGDPRQQRLERHDHTPLFQCRYLDRQNFVTQRIFGERELENVIVQLVKPAAVNKAYLVFARESGKRAVLDRFNTAVGAMREDGAYSKIVDTFTRALQDEVK